MADECAVQGCFRRDLLNSRHHAADAIPAFGASRKTRSMLIVLVALAVVFSLAAEMVYGYFADRHEVSWVRPELAEHAAIVRAQGRLRQNEHRI